MSEVLIAGKSVSVNEEGYLTDPSQWNREIAEQIAAEVNITLTPKHWEVLEYLRDIAQKAESISMGGGQN